MRYATWELNWQPDERYGIGPESVIVERGGSAEGVFFTGSDPHDLIVGYVHGDVSLDDLEAWNVTEITDEQVLVLAQVLDAGAVLDTDGRIGFPRPNLGA